MQKIFRFFGKEYTNINQAAFLLGLFSLFSQILGLFRDRSIAHFIGPSPLLDTYYAAFRVPDFIFISIASLASITVLIPFIADKDKSKKEVGDFIGNVFTIFFFLLFLVSGIVYIFIPEIIHFVAPGFPVVMQEHTIELSRIMLLSPVFLGLSNLFGAVTQLHRKFFIYALSPIFYNIGIITGVLVLYPYLGIEGLAVGVVLGAFLHGAIQVYASSRLGYAPKFVRKINWGQIKQVILTSLPRTLGLSFNNIALIAIVSFASFLSSGSISIFNLSLNLQSVPLGIIGLSYAVAAFPTLTKAYAQGNINEFKHELKQAANQIIFWSLPVAFLFIVLRAQIVRVILGSGFFSWEDTRLVAASLAVFSISIVAQGLIALFARGYYAIGNTKKPLYVNLFSSMSIVALSYVLIQVFNTYPVFRYFIENILKVEGIGGTTVLMLPLAYSLGTILNSLLLWVFIKRDFMPTKYFIARSFFQCLSASFLGGSVSYFALNAFASIFNTNTFFGIFFQGFSAGILGIVACILILYILKNRELSDLMMVLKTKFWKAKVVVPSQDTM